MNAGKELTEWLSREPFEPFAVLTTDGRRIVVAQRDRAVLNSLALSVVEEAFSVTVIALVQIEAIVSV
jgi:hypothetical protein